MANCRNCIHWDKCSYATGITRYYGKEIAANNVEKLCEWFISNTDVAPIADTVRKMQERLKKWFGDDLQRLYSNYNIHRYIDGAAKEMLEGG